MLISASNLKKIWKVCPTGVLHVGAHLAEESEDYVKLGWAMQNRIVWIEADPEIAHSLQTKLDPNLHEVWCATAWHVDGEELDFHIASNRASSSLLQFGSHISSYPNVEVVRTMKVKTRRLDSLLGQHDFDFINLDIQGVELNALIGLGQLIENVKWIYSEVNSEEVYLENSKLEDVDSYLNQKNFRRAFTCWEPGAGWGDALWINKDIVPSAFFVRNLVTRIYFSAYLSKRFFYKLLRNLSMRVSLFR